MQYTYSPCRQITLWNQKDTVVGMREKLLKILSGKVKGRIEPVKVQERFQLNSEGGRNVREHPVALYQNQHPAIKNIAKLIAAFKSLAKIAY